MAKTSALLVALALCVAAAFPAAEATVNTIADFGSRPRTASVIAGQCVYGNNNCQTFQNCAGGDSQCLCVDIIEGTSICIENQYCQADCTSSDECGPNGYCITGGCCGGNRCVYTNVAPFEANPVCPLQTAQCHRVVGGHTGGKKGNVVCSGTCGVNGGWGCCKYDSVADDCTCQLPAGFEEINICPGSQTNKKLFF